jgi:sialate O-acetylesterase
MKTMTLRRHHLAILLALLFAALPATFNAATLTIADPFGHNMILQHDMPLPVWGKAEPNATVTLTFAGQTKTARADASGNWKLKLDPLPASGENRTLTATAQDTTSRASVEINNVLVGEVWICSGQSNMEWGLNDIQNGREEIAAGTHPQIRFRYVARATAPVPQTKLKGSPWLECTPENLKRGTRPAGFSAIAYLYALELNRRLKIPVGVIATSWGGTRIEPWTSADGFRQTPGLEKQLATLPKPGKDGTPPRVASSTPTALYNAMIHPLVPYGIRGAIWYQGESNVGENNYTDKMRALVQGWRAAWQQGEFPFYYVQLAPHSYKGNRAGRLAEMWEQQTAALAIPNTAMAIINDIGDPKDIHPRNKHDVASRLARLALSRIHGQTFPDATGPLPKEIHARNGKIIVRFLNAGSGLATRDGKAPTHFEIAGGDQKYQPATATILPPATLELTNATVPDPRHVRFAWKDTASPNLVNGEKLPAGAFRWSASAHK